MIDIIIMVYVRISDKTGDNITYTKYNYITLNGWRIFNLNYTNTYILICTFFLNVKIDIVLLFMNLK